MRPEWEYRSKVPVETATSIYHPLILEGDGESSTEIGGIVRRACRIHGASVRAMLSGDSSHPSRAARADIVSQLYIEHQELSIFDIAACIGATTHGAVAHRLKDLGINRWRRESA